MVRRLGVLAPSGAPSTRATGSMSPIVAARAADVSAAGVGGDEASALVPQEFGLFWATGRVAPPQRHPSGTQRPTWGPSPEVR